MQVNRQEFLDLLSRVRPGLSSKDRVDQSSSFVFSEGNLLTYNESIMVIAPSPLEDIEGAVRAEELLAVLGKLKTETVDLSVDGGQLLIKAGRSKSGIRFEDQVRIPCEQVLAEYEECTEYNIPKTLLPALSTAKFCASKSMQDAKLTGIQVNDGYASSTDNYRIIRVTVKGGSKLPSFIIPASCVDSLQSYGPTQIAIGPAWAFFTNNNNVTFCCRLISDAADPYPDVASYLDVDGPEFTLPESVLDALDKADIFTKSAAHESDRFVELSIRPGRVIVRGSGEFGWYEESVVAKEYDGERLDFAAHPEFLKQIVPLVQRARLGENVVLFEGDNFRHVFAQSRNGQQEEE